MQRLSAIGDDGGTLRADVAAAESRSASDVELGHCDWVKLCIDVGLTEFEANRLHQMLSGESGQIAFCDVSKTLKTVVGPDASLTELVADLLEQHGSVRAAFHATFLTDAAKSEDRVMGWEEFCGLIECHDMSDRSARKLWSVLLAGLSEIRIADLESVTEDQFVDLLVPWSPDLLSWAPNVALRALEKQIDQRFDSLADCRKAMRHEGCPASMELSPEKLRDGLAAVGVLHCDADILMSKARLITGVGSSGQVTFEDIVEALRFSWQGSRKFESHHLLESHEEGMRVWKAAGGRRSRACRGSRAVSPTASISSTSVGESGEHSRCTSASKGSRSASRSTSRTCSKRSFLATSAPPSAGVLLREPGGVPRRRSSRPPARGCREDAHMPRLFESSGELMQPE
jgi:hypothetical protein